ncbi:MULTISPECIES: flavin-containing monooxygenase [Niastella]|uniref:NAD(P)/FAD-dependent oxidoreductase n=1 Tax=Niastella soli TaxID=2821487 RepID=A0ABS3Z1F5_9BACT|nr:NAD(P)/FAD-dependent oxidoreductase [Niastella soli]MBO9203863.1 NAD(P)/FAD-dependent oxidoreductase [Niastella soli]
MQPFTQTNTLIVGAGISGLATAACLKRQGIEYVAIEKHAQVASAWHNHYHRLHLHTNKRISQLPYRKFGKNIPRYPSRQQVIDYLNDYQQTFNIQPVFNTIATAIKKEGDYWLTQTTNGNFQSEFLVMATGPYGKPKPFVLQGMETFPGKILHSAAYKTGKDFVGQKVLVIGFGNSACEIAIDLFEQGATPVMAVRSAVNIVPRDVLGIPILELSLILNFLPPRIADLLSAPLANILIGDLTSLGLKRKPYGPLEQIQREGKAPVLDIGTIRLIRKGQIKIVGDLDRIDGKLVHFKEGTTQPFDAIIACIGYSRDEIKIIETDSNRFDDLRVSAIHQQYFGKDGLYFCGYYVSPTGQIREISGDARKIAKDISRRQ